MLESVEFLSQLRSTRAVNENDLINYDSELAIIKGQVDFRENLQVNLYRKSSKKIFVNDSLLKKQSEIRKYIRSVAFSSSDINIVKGEPSFRRIWLDKVVAQIEPVYIELLARFNKLLKQRSHLWRSGISNNYGSASLIDSFDDQMALIGTRILRRRRRALEKLQPFIQHWHQYLSKDKERVIIEYASSIPISDDDENIIKNDFLLKLENQRNIESITGKCSVGPHRDDVNLLINKNLVRKFGSSGQQRTMILALKMAELDLLRKVIAVDPILILDDVLAELDIVRQNLLLDAVGRDSQCLISATHLDKFNKNFIYESQIIHL